MSSNKEITKINPSEVQRIIEHRCSPLDQRKKMETKELVKFLQANAPSALADHISATQIYKWNKSGILLPAEETRNKDTIYTYNFEQIRRATLAAYLYYEKQIKPSEIAGAIALGSPEVVTHAKEYEFIYREWKRGWTFLCARLLGALSSLVTGSNGPVSDTIIICRPISIQDLKPGKDRFNVVSLVEVPELAPGKMIAGYSQNSPQAEIIAQIEDFTEIAPRVDGRKYFGYQVYSPTRLDQPFEIDLGIRDYSSDNRLKILTSTEFPDQDGSRISSESFKLVCRMLNYVSTAVLDMPMRFGGNDRRYGLPLHADQLDALCTAMVMANPVWESSAFFVKEEGDYLKIRSQSPAYPFDSHRILPLDPTKNLESSVFLSGNPVVMESVGENDPRIHESEKHLRTRPFAIVPTISSAGIQGIAYIGAVPQSDPADVNFEGDLIFLRFLAGLLGEAFARQQMVRVDHLLQLEGSHNSEYPAEPDLIRTLIDLIETQVLTRSDKANKKSTMGTNDMLALFVIKVEAQGDPLILDWFDAELCRQMGQFLRDQISTKVFLGSNNISVFRLRRGSLVALIRNVQRDVPSGDLRMQLQEHVLQFCKPYNKLNAYAWSVEYSYADLQRLLGTPSSTDRFAIEGRVHGILDQVKKALDNANYLRLAEQEFEKGNYDRAISQWNLVWSEDDPIRSRHLSEAFARKGDWKRALEYAEYAIAADEMINLPEYAGSYLRRAEAFEGLKRVSQALQDFKRAAQLSEKLSYQLDYASALIRLGNEDQTKMAFGILDALLRRQDVSEHDRSIIQFLRAKGYEKVGQEVKMIESLKSAFDSDRGNQFMKIEFSHASLQSKSNTRGDTSRKSIRVSR